MTPNPDTKSAAEMLREHVQPYGDGLILTAAQAEALIALIADVEPERLPSRNLRCRVCGRSWSRAAKPKHFDDCTYAAFVESLKP